jgi:hypothetical protein
MIVSIYKVQDDCASSIHLLTKPKVILRVPDLHSARSAPRWILVHTMVRYPQVRKNMLQKD